MNKKGFTLVELLAVIILLSLLGIFTVSTILEKTNENKGTVDKVTEKIIKTAAQEYVNLNNEKFERKSGNVYCLEISKILSASDIDDINANSKEKISLDNLNIKVTFLQGNYDLDVTSTCYSNASAAPSKPNLKSNMIPIKWDHNNNIVKADISKYGDWYDYTEKRWANAIIVTNDYLAALKNIEPGELIVPFNESIQDLIFVTWIPSFKYSRNSKDYVVTFTDLSSESHSAFKDNSGFWISKFEITKNTILGSTYGYNAYINSQSNLKSEIANISSNYNFLTKESSISMVNNYEWVAAAILANSQYGVGSEKILVGDSKTGLLKNVDVGYAANEPKIIPLTTKSSLSTSDAYYSANSILTSSTRNVTGVYGLAGGADEWVSDSAETLKSIYNLEPAALSSIISHSDSCSKSDYDVNSDNNYCLARGGNTKTGCLFTFEFYSCTSNLSTRMVVK